MSEVDDKMSQQADILPITTPPLNLPFVDELLPYKPREQARRLRMHRTHWLDIRSGRKTASLGTALRVSEVTGVDVKDLWPTKKKARETVRETEKAA